MALSLFLFLLATRYRNDIHRRHISIRMKRPDGADEGSKYEYTFFSLLVTIYRNDIEMI